MSDDETWFFREHPWPLILLGPMVRRVDESSASVFVALSESAHVSLKLYEGTGASRTAVTGGTSAQVQTKALGAKLHVVLVRVTGVSLSPGTVYGYDLSMRTGGGTYDLASNPNENLLDGEVPLGYDVGALPSFVLPHAAADLRVVHASCRKSHGCDHVALSDPDVLPLVDRLIRDNRDATTARPQQLILTGDQIYSDDVPAALLQALTQVAAELMGWTETLPLRTSSDLLAPDHWRLEPGKRSDFLDDEGVKTKPADADPAAWTDYAANHLLFFGEWCAMYLMAWSPVLWRKRDPAEAGEPSYMLQEADKVWSDSPDTTTPALIYAENLALIRRALANIATYTIFDDHDVTDDWFLNNKVMEQQRGARSGHEGPTGRRMLRNGLAAYAVFQHWGNVPDDFGPGTNGETLLGYLDASASGTPRIGQSGQETCADVLLDVGAAPIGVARRSERMRWDYEVLGPEHRLLFVDTRTWREYPGAPQRIDLEGLLLETADEIETFGDWGPDALRTLATNYGNAAVIVIGAGDAVLGTVLVELAAAAEAGAELAERLADGVPTLAAEAQAALDALVTALDALFATTAISDYAWAQAAITTAKDKLVAITPDDADGPLEMMAAIVADINAIIYVLRTEIDDAVYSIGSASISAAEQATLTILAGTAELLRAFADLCTWARPSAAKAADAAARWVATTTPIIAELAARAADELAADSSAALTSVADEAGLIQSELETVVQSYQGWINPLWDTLIGSGRDQLNAGLIAEDMLPFMVGERLAGPARDINFVVSGAPVFGNWIVEMAQRGGIISGEYQAPSNTDETLDNEPWSGNTSSFERFLDALTAAPNAIILSGDVHYAFSNVNDYRGRNGNRARFVQLCSSSAKNADANTKFVGLLDEYRDELLSCVMMQFDFTELLPTDAELQDYSDQARAKLQSLRVPTRDEVVAELRRRRDAMVAKVDDAVAAFKAWWAIEIDYQALARETYEAAVLEARKLSAAGMHTIAEYWQNPERLVIDDVLYSSPLIQDQVLLLLGGLGIDPAQLWEVESTVLADRRTESRADDSPGLRTRLAVQQPKWHERLGRDHLVRLDRTTVGHANVGVVSFAEGDEGTQVVHELHFFVFDAPEGGGTLDPGFRDDWIITRHVAGLALGTTRDQGPTLAELGEGG